MEVIVEIPAFRAPWGDFSSLPASKLESAFDLRAVRFGPKRTVGRRDHPHVDPFAPRIANATELAFWQLAYESPRTKPEGRPGAHAPLR